MDRSAIIIRLPEVKRRTGLSRSSIYKFIKNGAFPRPMHLGPRAIGWPDETISAWIAARRQA